MRGWAGALTHNFDLTCFSSDFHCCKIGLNEQWGQPAVAVRGPLPARTSVQQQALGLQLKDGMSAKCLQLEVRRELNS